MMDDNQLRAYARHLGVSFPLLKETAEKGRLPVVNFAAGGIGKVSHETWQLLNILEGLLSYTLLDSSKTFCSLLRYKLFTSIYFTLKWILL